MEWQESAPRRFAAEVDSRESVEQRPEREEPSLSATMDGRTLYYTQHDRQNVIKMMEISQ